MASRKSASRDFEAEEASLRDQLDVERWKAVYALRGLEEEWARSIAHASSRGALLAAMSSALAHGLAPEAAKRAAEHLAHAEKWQAEIASWATSGAEGLARTAELHELMLARAWLLEASGSDAATRRRVRQICTKLARDPNGISKSLRAALEKLQAKLG